MPIREHAPLTIEGMDAASIVELRARRPDRAAMRAGAARGPGLALRGDRRGRPRARREARPRPSARAGPLRPRASAVVTDPARAARAVADPRGRLGHRRPAAPTAARPGRAGRTRPCRPSGSAPTCASSTRCSTSTARRGRLLRALRRRLHPRAHRLRPAHRGGRRGLPRVHGATPPTCGRARRLALGRARRRAGARRAAGADVRAASWSRRSARSRRSGTRTAG